MVGVWRLYEHWHLLIFTWLTLFVLSYPITPPPPTPAPPLPSLFFSTLPFLCFIAVMPSPYRLLVQGLSLCMLLAIVAEYVVKK